MLKRRKMGAETEALDGERFQPQVASLFVELRPAEHVDPLSLGEAELERIELAARHLDGQRRSLLRVLEREEHGRPALLAA